MAAATGNAALAQAAAQAHTARQVLEILTQAGDLRALDTIGRSMLNCLRSYAGPGPALVAVILDFNGLVLWRGEQS